MTDFIYNFIGNSLGNLILKLKLKNPIVFYAIQGVLIAATGYIGEGDIMWLDDNYETTLVIILGTITALLTQDTTVVEEEKRLKRQKFIKMLKAKKDEPLTGNNFEAQPVEPSKPVIEGVTEETETETTFTVSEPETVQTVIESEITDDEVLTIAEEVQEELEDEGITDVEYNTAFETLSDEEFAEVYEEVTGEEYGDSNPYLIWVAGVLLAAVAGTIFYFTKY